MSFEHLKEDPNFIAVQSNPHWINQAGGSVPYGQMFRVDVLGEGKEVWGLFRLRRPILAQEFVNKLKKEIYGQRGSYLHRHLCMTSHRDFQMMPKEIGRSFLSCINPTIQC